MPPLRIATRDDAPAIAGLAASFREHLQRAAPTDAQFLESVQLLLASEDAEFYLIDAEGQPAGYVLQRFRHSMWAAGTEATLEDLFVDPGCRRSGFGRELVAFAVARARARGCRTVCLDTNEHNAASRRIYEQLGFSAHSARWNGNQIFLRLNLA